MIPTVGDMVQYTKRVVPRSGAAIGGALEVHAAMVLRVRAREGLIAATGGLADRTNPGLYLLDLKIWDLEGDTYLLRGVPHGTNAGEKDAEGRWTERPETLGGRLEWIQRIVGLK